MTNNQKNQFCLLKKEKKIRLFLNGDMKTIISDEKKKKEIHEWWIL